MLTDELKKNIGDSVADFKSIVSPELLASASNYLRKLGTVLTETADVIAAELSTKPERVKIDVED